MCQEFKCLWLADDKVPGSMKPELSGVILYTDPSNTWLVLTEAGSEISIEHKNWANKYAKEHSLKYIEGK